MTVWIYTGGRPSTGAGKLAKTGPFRRGEKLGFLKPEDLVVNWGSSKPLPRKVETLLNKPDSVKRAINKLLTFSYMHVNEIPTVAWTTDVYEAMCWQSKVVVRHSVDSSGGRGIEIVDKDQPLPDAPLYTRYEPYRRAELRVHVFMGKLIDIQRKIRDPKREPATWAIRNHGNGFIYAREHVVWRPELAELAIRAVGALGLDFGAVDMLECKDGTYKLLEVNTAPGLVGATLTKYVEAIKEQI